jgi:hypothetical protein
MPRRMGDGYGGCGAWLGGPRNHRPEVLVAVDVVVDDKDDEGEEECADFAAALAPAAAVAVNVVVLRWLRSRALWRKSSNSQGLGGELRGPLLLLHQVLPVQHVVPVLAHHEAPLLLVDRPARARSRPSHPFFIYLAVTCTRSFFFDVIYLGTDAVQIGVDVGNRQFKIFALR